MRRPGDKTLLFLLAAANFLCVLWIFHRALTIVPNTGDEFSTLFQAKIFAALRATTPAPTLPVMFAGDFIGVRDGRWFSIYPPGYALLLAPGIWLGSPAVIVALMSSAILALAFLLVRDLYGDRPLAWAATFLLCVSPSFRFHSSSYYSHVGSLLALAACLLLMIRRRWLACGIAAGLGLAIRPFEFFLALVPLCVYLSDEPWRGKALRSRRKEILLAGLAVAVAAACLMFYSARQSGDPSRSLYWQMVNHGGRFGLGRNRNPGPRLGDMLADTAKWLFGLGRFASGNLHDASSEDRDGSWLMLAGAIAFGLYEALKKKKIRQMQLLWLSMILFSIAGHMLYNKEGGRFGERRFFELSFVFCLLAARLVISGLRRLKQERLAWAAFAVLAAPNILHYLPSTIEYYRSSNAHRFLPYAMAEQRGIRDSLIFIEDAPDFYPRFYVRNEPDLSGNVYSMLEPWEPSGVAKLFPDRPKYVFRRDPSLGDYLLVPFKRKAP